MANAPAGRTPGDPAPVKAGDPIARATGTEPDVTSEPRPAPDASDVVTGPVGSASLKEPSAPGIRGADLEELDATAVTSAD